MRLKAIALILLGIALVLVAGVATFQYTRNLETEVAATRRSLRAFGDTVALPVPNIAVAPHAVLQPENFRTVYIPASYVPPNALTQLPAPGPGRGLVALVEMEPNAIILRDQIVIQGEEDAHGLLISPGGRAIAVEPRNMQDFIGRLSLGNMVDLLWTREIGGGLSETRLVGAGLRILAMPVAETPGAEPKKLVLEALPQEAMRVIAVGKAGFFSILPSRGPLPEGAKEYVVDLMELKGLPLAVSKESRRDPIGLPSASPAAAGGTCSTAVIRAGTRSVIEIPC